jgi:hypothetical protein
MELTKHRVRWITVLILACLSMAACGDGSAENAKTRPVTIQAVKGTELSRVTLTKDAARRLDIQTEPVRAVGSPQGTQIPYAAVFYDPKGNTWVFVQLGGLTFQRSAIAVDHIEGDVAFLADGPQVGTKVVTVGGSELYGAEIGVGDDE